MTFSKTLGCYVREEGNSMVVGWIHLVFLRVFRYWHDVTELEDCIGIWQEETMA